MSTNSILPGQDEVETDGIHFREGPAILPAQAAPSEPKSGDRWLGILGLIGVGAILGASVYSIVRYLW